MACSTRSPTISLYASALGSISVVLPTLVLAAVIFASELLAKQPEMLRHTRWEQASRRLPAFQGLRDQVGEKRESERVHSGSRDSARKRLVPVQGFPALKLHRIMSHGRAGCSAAAGQLVQPTATEEGPEGSRPLLSTGSRTCGAASRSVPDARWVGRGADWLTFALPGCWSIGGASGRS